MLQIDKYVRPLPVPGYHPVTRWLHAALVLGVVFQLVCAAMMAHPEHADAGFVAGAVAHAETVKADVHQPAHKNDVFGELLMAAHRTGGTLVVLIVLANLLWAIMARGKPRKRQLAVVFLLCTGLKPCRLQRGFPLC